MIPDKPDPLHRGPRRTKNRGAEKRALYREQVRRHLASEDPYVRSYFIRLWMEDELLPWQRDIVEDEERRRSRLEAEECRRQAEEATTAAKRVVEAVALWEEDIA